MSHFVRDLFNEQLLASPQQLMRDEVLAGLLESPRRLPSKYFYDERGSLLFEEITELEEYYLTRTERGIMDEHIDEMVGCLGPHCLLIEYGSGSSLKTRKLLAHLPNPAAYVPIDISREHLFHSAEELTNLFPGLNVLPVCADYTMDFALPLDVAVHNRRVVYFPGSTIGNFTPKEARDFMLHVATVVGQGGGLMIGVDLRKDPAILEAAYNDKKGITAAFNKNMLHNLNREINTAFDVDMFGHRAIFNVDESRIEMHLVSRSDQCVVVGNVPIPFREHEVIVTEYSYKYEPSVFAKLAEEAGFMVSRVWKDPAEHFSIQYLEAV